MTSSLLLTAYAVIAGTLGARLLRDADWSARAPRRGIAAWQALATSVLLALSSAGLALAVSLSHVSTDLARLFNLCADALQHGYSAPGGTATALLGVSLFAAMAARVAWCAGQSWWLDRTDRRTRVAALDLVGQSDVLPGALVIEHPAPYAFCVGGRRHRVVVTTGLLTALDSGQLKAVIAHERAHLRQRHHLTLVVSRALFGALSPLFPTFRQAMSQVRTLVEMSADDGARRRVGARDLRGALSALARLPAPSGSLGASGSDVATRLQRLEGHPAALGRLGDGAAALGIAMAVAIPLALTAGPILTMAWEGICTLA